MKRIIASLLAGILVTIAISPAFAQTPPPEASATAAPSPIPTEVNSYDMFWPITAGRTMGDSLYFLKSLKENLREFLVFSSYKKADYNITLSAKRVVEAENLFIEKKDVNNAKKSLEAAQSKRDKALEFIKKAESEGRYIVDLKTTLKNSLEKQRALLHYLITKVDEESKKFIEDNVSALNETFAKVEG